MERSRFDNLRNGTPARLATLRAKLAKSLETVARVHGTDSALYAHYVDKGIRAERYDFPSGPGYVNYSPDKGGVIYADSGALDHLRKPSESDMPRDYRNGLGWYCDEFQDSTASGRVAVLPSRNRVPLFLAYVVMSGCDGITIDASAYSDPVAAWNNADRLAHRIAEDAYADSVLQNEAAQLVNKDEADADSMKACRAKVARAVSLLREIPADSANRPSLCADIRNAHARMRDALGRIAKRAPELAELRARGADV